MEQQIYNNPDQYSSNNARIDAFETSQILENLIFNVRAVENQNQCLMKQFDHFYNIKVHENTLTDENDLKTASLNMIANLKSIVEKVKGVQANVLNNHLVTWKINRKFIANGGEFLESS